MPLPPGEPETQPQVAARRALDKAVPCGRGRVAVGDRRRPALLREREDLRDGPVGLGGEGRDRDGRPLGQRHVQGDPVPLAAVDPAVQRPCDERALRFVGRRAVERADAPAAVDDDRVPAPVERERADAERAVVVDGDPGRAEAPGQPLRGVDPLDRAAVGGDRDDVVGALLDHVQPALAVDGEVRRPVELHAGHEAAVAVGGEDVDDAVRAVGDEDVAVQAGGDIPRLPDAGPGVVRRDRRDGPGRVVDAVRAPHGAQREALEREDLNPAVAGVGDVEVAAAGDRDSVRVGELPRLGARAADARQRLERLGARVVSLDERRPGVEHVDTVVDVDGHARRRVETAEGAVRVGQRYRAAGGRLKGQLLRGHEPVERRRAPARRLAEQDMAAHEAAS